MKAQTICSRLPEHSRIRTLILVIPIIFGCNIGHQPPSTMWMVKYMRGGTPLVVISGVKIGGLIMFGPIHIILWIHGNLGFEKG